ncbi:hypothetical protein IWY39_000042 [Sphingobium sp. JAI105]|uniref:hypothetical protein n=1 Tax=Sphingobium sp. JAI105 TaxID=2787715 RepID=UPI0018CA065F|nr:hypothetical protein [Sphingobium sp. JAI105]MBG6116238.1 hypothetical protein [Sphingobium sp. JAI105]
MTRFTLIHGPIRSGKTFHSDKFRRHFHCHAAIDLDDLPKLHRKAQKDGLLLLTNLAPDIAEKRIREIVRDADIDIIDIKTARRAIGVSAAWEGAQ